MVGKREGKMKTVTIKPSVWKELYHIKGNEGYQSMSDVIEDLLKKRKGTK
ncbi:hypothetical protein HYV50_03390 [Candidatus Pacearchaeota archaeon]|nr:hypothetical protein [Candidatus Pacearchaeota archaeon]